MIPRKRLITMALAAAAGAIALLAAWSRDPVSVVESSASHHSGAWEKRWRESPDQGPFRLGQDRMPPSLPGPLDAWAGGQVHALTLTAHVPAGHYQLELMLYDAHRSAPPRLMVEVNDQKAPRVAVRRGRGQGAPYHAIQPRLTVSVPVTLREGENTIRLTNSEGSWCALALARLTSGWRFNPAKCVFLICSHAAYAALIVWLMVISMYGLAAARLGGRRAGLALVLCGCSIGLSLVLAELATRAALIRRPEQRTLQVNNKLGRAQDEAGTHYTYATMVRPSAQPGIPYRLKPNLNGFFARNPLRTNADGMRGDPVERLKKPGVVRIAGLGDSVMFGWGVSEEENALNRLGRLWEKTRGGQVETLNFGCPSYNTAVEVETYRSWARAYRPDIVVLIFMENDFGFPGLMLAPVRMWTWRRCYLLEQIRRRMAARWNDAEFEQETMVSTRSFDNEEADPAAKPWLNDVRRFYEDMTGMAAVRNQLLDLGALLRQDGALGVLVYNPIVLTVGDPASREKHTAEVLEAARAAGLLAIDMADTYEQYLREKGLTRMEEGLWLEGKDWHPNAAGHALIAQAVFDALPSRLMSASAGN